MEGNYVKVKCNNCGMIYAITPSMKEEKIENKCPSCKSNVYKLTYSSFEV